MQKTFEDQYKKDQTFNKYMNKRHSLTCQIKISFKAYQKKSTLIIVKKCKLKLRDTIFHLSE